MNKRTLVMEFRDNGKRRLVDQQSTQNPVIYTQKPGQTEFIDIATSFSNGDDLKDLESCTPSDDGNSEGWGSIASSLKSESTSTSTREDLKLDCPIDKTEETPNTHLIVPVLPNEKLECLLIASIELCKKGRAEDIEMCRYLFQGVAKDFAEVLTHNVSWKPTTHTSMKSNCEKLIELCISKLHEDWFCLLDSLALLFDPNNKFNTIHIAKISELKLNIPEEELYARSYDPTAPRGWLVDLINRFGSLGGFNILLNRFQNKRTNLTIPVIHALIRPFGLCIQFLTADTLDEYFLPIVQTVIRILNNSVDEELKNEATSDQIFAILAVSKTLITPILDRSEMTKELNTLRMKMILRILQISSHNGKMSAVNEINKIIIAIKSYNVGFCTERQPDCLTAEYVIQWINKNGVLESLFGDTLDQPEYVGKLEKILQFMIEERAFSLEFSDKVCTAQIVKKQVVVKNVHNLLTKLVRDLSTEQLDHLFECCKISLKTANNEHRGKILGLMRRLTENDRDGKMSHKVVRRYKNQRRWILEFVRALYRSYLEVLSHLWNCVHLNFGFSTEVRNQTFNIYVKILESQTDDVRFTWLNKFVEILKTDEQWVLPAIKYIREICLIFAKNPHLGDKKIKYRQADVIKSISDATFVFVVTNLVGYMTKMRNIKRTTPTIDLDTHRLHKEYSHKTQVQERLNFLKFLLDNGNLLLPTELATSIWECLVEQSVHDSDLENCFAWFSKLIKDRRQKNFEQFFKDKVLKLDPARLTVNGFDCYERFFKTVNLKSNEKILKIDNRVNFIGIDYLWKLVYKSRKEVVNRGLKLLEQIYVERRLQNIL